MSKKKEKIIEYGKKSKKIDVYGFFRKLGLVRLRKHSTPFLDKICQPKNKKH